MRAQFALLRLFKRGGDDAQTAVTLFHAVDSGQIVGVFGDDLAVAARMAARRGTVRWQLVPAGGDAVLINDGLPDAPAIVFREGLSASALDDALLSTYRSHQSSLGPVSDEKSAPRCNVAAPLPKVETPPPQVIPPTPGPPPPIFGSCSTLLRTRGPAGRVVGVGSGTVTHRLMAGTQVGVLLENHAPIGVTVEVRNLATGAAVMGVPGPSPVPGGAGRRPHMCLLSRAVFHCLGIFKSPFR